MTDTFRSLCAELTFCWSRTTNPDDFAENAAPIIGRMKAALAQPAPEGQSSLSEDYWRKDALQKLIDAATRYRLGVFSAEELELFEDRARAVLARWGRPVTATETP